jgi:hypothetical protein
MLARAVEQGLARAVEQDLADLPEDLRQERTVTPELMSDVMAQAGIRLAGLNSARAVRLRRLIEAEAWTDAALALIELALPQWQLVRLVGDDGEWCCSLSRHPQLPEWLDDAVEARHEVLPLAILAAFLTAREASPAVCSRKAGTVPECRPQQPNVLHALRCEDFA